MATEKVVSLGIERDPDYLYFIRGNEVVRSKRDALSKRETVTKFQAELDPAFTYFLDGTGDISRSLRPGMKPAAVKTVTKRGTKAPSVKFDDPNLQLAVLAGLYRAGKVEIEPSKLPIATDVGPDEDDEDYDGTPDIYTYNQTVADLLLAIELPAGGVATLEAVDWVDDDITKLIFPQWSGEEHEFDVHDLTGIERCKALTSLRLHASTDVKSIAPLASLTSLETLSLWGARVSDVRPLGSLVSLRQLDLSHCPIRSIAVLCKLARLETLELRSTKIADLSPLLELSNLAKLTLSWSGSTPSADVKTRAKKVVAQLKKRSVEVDVDWS